MDGCGDGGDGDAGGEIINGGDGMNPRRFPSFGSPHVSFRYTTIYILLVPT